MPLSYSDQINATVDSFDVKLQYFINKKTKSGSSSSPISGSDFYGFTTGSMVQDKFWLTPHVGLDYITTASSYAAITIPFNGVFEQSLNEGEIDYSVTIDNIQDQEYLPEIGDQIFCFRKITPRVGNSNPTGLLTGTNFEYQQLGQYAHQVTRLDGMFLDKRGTFTTGSGKYGAGYQVCGSATNYILYPSFEQITWSGSSGSITDAYACTSNYYVLHDNAYSGSQAYYIRASGTGSAWNISLAKPALAANTTYTVSVHINQRESDQINKARLQVVDYRSSGSTSEVFSDFNANTGWQRHVATITTSASHSYLDIRIKGASTCSEGELYLIDALQCESGNEPTRYFDGYSGSGCAWSGISEKSYSTRIANKTYYDPPGFNQNYGSVAFWANLYSVSGSKYLWGGSLLGSYVSASNIYFINGGIAGNGHAASTGWHHYIYTWSTSTSQRMFYCDGEASASQSYSLSGSNVFGLGYNYDLSACYSNAVFDDLMIYGKAIDANTISMLYTSTSQQETGNNWHFWWTGIVTDMDEKRDYKGGIRNINIGSIKTLFSSDDSPRIEVSDNDAVTFAASVEVSGTLSTPESEINNGEFVGALVNVDGSNIVDGRLNTVWISQFAPSVAIESPPYPDPPTIGNLIVDEFFFKPTPGWKDTEVWWFEVLNQGPGDMSLDGPWNVEIFAYTTNDEWSLIDVKRLDDGGNREHPKYLVPEGGRFIVCGNQEKFEEYTGGARFAEFILEADSLNTIKIEDTEAAMNNYVRSGGTKEEKTPNTFNINPEYGYIIISNYAELRHVFDIVPWGQHANGTSILEYAPSFLDVGTDNWKDGALTITASALTAGQSYRRNPSGLWTKSASDFTVENYPKPGEKFYNRIFEWVKIELNDLVSLTYGDTNTADSGSLICDTLVGWPLSGSGLIEGEIIKYTNRTDTTFILSGSLSNTHLEGARVYPLDEEGVSMTGWPIKQINIKRKPGVSKIREVWVHTSKYPDRASGGDENWESDYEGYANYIMNGTTSDNANYTIKIPTIQKNGNPYWVRSIMIHISVMWDGGRAKINDVECILAAPTINSTSNDDIDDKRSVDIIKYLLDNHTTVNSASLLQDYCSSLHGYTANMQIAIAPIPEVFNNVCKNSGTWIKYNTDGKIQVHPNQYWPKRAYVDDPYSPMRSYLAYYLLTKDNIPYDYYFTGDSIREVLNITNKKSTVTGVSLTPISPNGEALPTVIFPPSASGTSVVEYNDFVCSEYVAADLARSLYDKERNQKNITFIVKGVGSGFEAGQIYNIEISGSYMGRYICDKVSINWSLDNSVKKWETTISATKF